MMRIKIFKSGDIKTAVYILMLPSIRLLLQHGILTVPVAMRGATTNCTIKAGRNRILWAQCVMIKPLCRLPQPHR